MGIRTNNEDNGYNPRRGGRKRPQRSASGARTQPDSPLADPGAERAKELQALHAVAEVLLRTDLGPGGVLQEIAELLPLAFRFPGIAGASVRVGEVHVATERFAVASPWILAAEFGENADVSGSIKVSYSDARPGAGLGPFLPEERALLNTIARMVCATFQHRAMEAALGRSEEQLRHIVESIDEVFWLYDWATGQHIYLNSAFEKVWGAKVNGHRDIARVFLDSILLEDRPAVATFLGEQRQQLACEVCYRILRPDGTIRWIHDRAFPIRDSEGRPYRTAGVAKDITATADSEQQFASGVARISSLTPRQRQVLQLLAEGKSVKEAAFLLGRSPKTIETHKAELMQRLRIPDIAALVRFAMRQGLIR